MWLHAVHRGLSVGATATSTTLPFGIWEIGVTAAATLGAWGSCYIAFMDALPAHARDADDVAAIATKCRCRWIRRRWSRCRRTSSGCG